MAEGEDQEDRTEAASARRLQKAREEGQVPVSRESVALAGLCLATLALCFVVPGVARDVARMLAWMLGQAHAVDLSNNAGGVAWVGVRAFLLGAAPFVLAALVGGVGAVLVQTGFLVHPGGLTPKLSGLNPLAGFKRLFGVEGVVETLKSVVKLGAICAAVWLAVGRDWQWLAASVQFHPAVLLDRLARLLFRVLLAVLGAQAVIALADLAWVRYRHAARLRMSRHDVREEHRETEGDPTQFDRVLVNLAVNARDAMRGDGTLTLHSGHVSLFRPLSRGAETIPPGHYVMVEIRDTGAGIPPDVLPRIFEPFFTTKRDSAGPGGGGSGLGLATVHGIVRQSGGFLTVESVLGEGTKVRLYLPRAGGPVDPPVPSLLSGPVVDGAEKKGGGTVLLVDDEAMVRDLTARALRQRGWVVLACDSAESALALLESDRPEALAAVISDVTMPGLDGPALVRALRERQPGLPAILISGYAQESLRAALTADGIAFLPKPYPLKALAELLEAVLRGDAGA